MFVMQQKAADGLPYLKKAAQLHLDAIDPHRILVDAYTQLGRQADANQEIIEAERIRAEGGCQTWNIKRKRCLDDGTTLALESNLSPFSPTSAITPQMRLNCSDQSRNSIVFAQQLCA